MNSLKTKGDMRVGVRCDILGLGGYVESSTRLPITTVRIDESLDDFMAKFRAALEPHWNRARHSAAMNGLEPECTDKYDTCPCYFWKQKGALCGPCEAYGKRLEEVSAGRG